MIKKNNTVIFKRGLYFPRPVVLLSFFIALISLFAILDAPLLAVPVTFLSAAVALTKWAVEMNKESHSIRGAVVFMWMRLGKWKDYSQYTDIAILKRKIGRKTYSAYSQTAVNEVDSKYSIFLLDPSHRKKLELDQYDTQEEAQSILQKVSNYFDLKASIYSPQVSQRTRHTRR